jgi:myo-inositol catabolism protein IolS
MIPTLRVPHTEFSFSRIGFGCEQLGMYNWGDVDQNELKSAICEALESGINYFDTADVYGLGDSERNLGVFLGSKRKKIHVITKFGVRFNGKQRYFDNSPKWINSAVEQSLKRLQTDYIDLYQLHFWDGITELDLILETLLRLKSSGKIRAFGFSNLAESLLLKNTEFINHVSSCSYEYSLAQKKNENTIMSFQKNMIFLAYGGLGQGILTGKYNKSSVFRDNDRRSSSRYENFFGDKLERNLAIVDVLKYISNCYNVSIASVALRYVIDSIPNSSIICGMKHRNQVQSNLEVFTFTLSQRELELLNNVSYEKTQ